MALRIRLQRCGKPHAPVYNVVVTESAFRRDGRFVEQLGYYNPKAHNKEPEVKIDRERIEYWLSVGAQPSDIIRGILRKDKKAEAVTA